MTQFSNKHLGNKQEIRASYVSYAAEKEHQLLSGPTAAAVSTPCFLYDGIDV